MKTYTENKKVIEKLESDLNINIEIDASRCDIDITTSKLRQRLESGNIDSFGAVTITPAQ